MARRLRIVSSSSDEDDEVSVQPPIRPAPPQELHEIDEDDQTISTLNLQNVTLNSSNSISNPIPRNSNIVQPVPFNISDDDDGDGDTGTGTINVSTITGHGLNYSNSTNHYPSSDNTISNILQGLGLRLRSQWLETCIRGLEGSVQGFSELDDSTKAKLCFQQFLHVDINFCGAGVLPENVDGLHLVDLKGPFVLQVDEIVNISCPLKGRYQKAAAGIKRCLKLSMTDGVQRVFGMEYRPIKDLDVFSPPGLKVVISNVNVRRGLLMLVPEVIEILGGKVQVLVAAQERLIYEVNKPPRGKRTRTGLVTPLARRATLAAWPPESVQDLDNGNSRAEAPPIQMDQQGTSSDTPAGNNNRESHAVPIQRTQAEAAPAGMSEVHPVTRLGQHAGGMEKEPTAVTVAKEEAEPNLLNNEVMDIEDIHMVNSLEMPSLIPLEKESPFTYLADLSAKWASMKHGTSKVQGKIKCFLTGVKGFQYKHRTTYELRVYIDDGSLISEILIEHNVVQKGIGYTPVEVSTALASSDSRQGTMLVELSESSSVPVATEMDQGCPASDAWLLLQRVRSSSSAQQRQHPYLNAINLSP